MSMLTTSVVSMKQVSQSDQQSASGTENGPRVQCSQNTPTLEQSQEMGPLATKIDCTDSVNTDITYYGIYIPSETQLIEDNEQLHVYIDKTEALKIVKRYKKARFKAFKSKEDAVHFAVNGSEILSHVSASQTDGPEATSPLVFEKPSLFKGPKAQDLVQLRKYIENCDLDKVSSTVWNNPRYLVSSGDTPAILQEGSRYNALHVAAKARMTAMCEFIIQTVIDPAFVGLLYGDDNLESCQERAAILLDLYLNTPDKGLNETPLHFAVKFGAVGVVEALVSCPQCDKNSKNKFGQTPTDIVCSRIGGDVDATHLKREILSLLEERFYVPVLRSEDNSLQPAVGFPFSPSCPLALNTDPISPRVEIHAYAGPMSHDEAVVFRKKWKTPPRIQRTPSNAFPQCSNVSSLRLQDTEKGLERVGRELAQEFKVSWKEFWPFIGIFTDLSTSEGLQKLEVYLKNRFMQVFIKSPPKENVKQMVDEKEYLVPVSSTSNSDLDNGAISPISDLCLAFKACSLSEIGSKHAPETKRTVTKFIDMHGGDMCSNTENDALMNVLTNPGLSPLLYVEKSCQVFAKRIADGLVHLVVLDEVMRDSQTCSVSVFDFLLVEVKHLQVLVNSYMDDPRFVSVDFHVIHCRIASLVAMKTHKLSSWDVELIISCLRLTLLARKGIEPPSSDEEDLTNSNSVYRKLRKSVERRNKKFDVFSQNHVKCLAQSIVDALAQLEENDSTSIDMRVDTEDECIKVWSNAITCTCNWHMQNFSRNSRKGASLKRSQSMKPVVITDSGKYGKIPSLNCISRKLSYSDNSDHEDIISSTNQNQNSQSGRSDTQDYKYQMDASDTDEGSESDVDEAFYTPPTSPEEASSEEEMATADEGIGVYIEGENPSKMDLAVLQAIQECDITAAEYPNVYRWKHLVLLHNEKERNSWASPATLRRLQKARTQHAASPVSSSPRVFRNPHDRTSPHAWHRIAGPYTPLRSNCHAD